MKWSNVMQHVRGRSPQFAGAVFLDKNTSELWWTMYFGKPRAKRADVRIHVLVRAAARGFRSIGKPELESVPAVPE